MGVFDDMMATLFGLAPGQYDPDAAMRLDPDSRAKLRAELVKVERIASDHRKSGRRIVAEREAEKYKNLIAISADRAKTLTSLVNARDGTDAQRMAAAYRAEASLRSSINKYQKRISPDTAKVIKEATGKQTPLLKIQAVTADPLFGQASGVSGSDAKTYANLKFLGDHTQLFSVNNGKVQYAEGFDTRDTSTTTILEELVGQTYGEYRLISETADRAKERADDFAALAPPGGDGQSVSEDDFNDLQAALVAGFNHLSEGVEDDDIEGYKDRIQSLEADDEQLQRLDALAKRFQAALDADTSTRGLMMKALANPNYVAWAESNGLRVGSVVTDDEGRPISYTPGPQDAHAAGLFWFQHNTGLRMLGQSRKGRLIEVTGTQPRGLSPDEEEIVARVKAGYTKADVFGQPFYQKDDKTWILGDDGVLKPATQDDFTAIAGSPDDGIELADAVGYHVDAGKFAAEATPVATRGTVQVLRELSMTAADAQNRVWRGIDDSTGEIVVVSLDTPKTIIEDHKEPIGTRISQFMDSRVGVRTGRQAERELGLDDTSATGAELAARQTREASEARVDELIAQDPTAVGAKVDVAGLPEGEALAKRRAEVKYAEARRAEGVAQAEGKAARLTEEAAVAGGSRRQDRDRAAAARREQLVGITDATIDAVPEYVDPTRDARRNSVDQQIVNLRPAPDAADAPVEGALDTPADSLEAARNVRPGTPRTALLRAEEDAGVERGEAQDGSMSKLDKLERTVRRLRGQKESATAKAERAELKTYKLAARHAKRDADRQRTLLGARLVRQTEKEKQLDAKLQGVESQLQGVESQRTDEIKRRKTEGKRELPRLVVRQMHEEGDPLAPDQQRTQVRLPEPMVPTLSERVFTPVGSLVEEAEPDSWAPVVPAHESKDARSQGDAARTYDVDSLQAAEDDADQVEVMAQEASDALAAKTKEALAVQALRDRKRQKKKEEAAAAEGSP